MIFERQENQVKIALKIGQDKISQLQQVRQIYLNDQFQTIQELEDILLEDITDGLYLDCSLDLAFLLIHECANDKYRIEHTFNRLFQHYLKNEKSDHLINILSFLLNYFHEYIYLQGDKLFGQLISQDQSKVQKILNLLKVALRPQKNQVRSLDLNIEKLNSIQGNAADVEDIYNLVDALIKLAQQTMFTGKMKDDKSVEKVDQKTEEQLKIDALNVLLLLRNKLNKQQKKKAIALLSSNINLIEAICQKDVDLMTDYLYFLNTYQEDFHKQKEILVLEKMCEIINQYLKNITINEYIYKINYQEKFPFSRQLQTYLKLFQKTEGGKEATLELNKLSEIYSNQERFLLCKNTAYEITVKLFFSQKREKIMQKNSTIIFEIILSLSKLCFSIDMSNENTPLYDTELFSCLKGVYDFICEEKKIQFLHFLYSKLAEIDKGAEVINGVVTQVEIEDKFTAIGCYIILEYLSSKLVEDMKGYSLRFMNFISYHLLDEYIFPSVVSFLAEMANYFTSNITAYHKSFMPQLVSIIQQTKNQLKKESIIDTFGKLYDQLIFLRIKDMYPYLKDIFQFLVEEYTSKDFFDKEMTYTDIVQNLIIQIINLKDIELYLKEEILNYADAFVSMINDPQERSKLIAKNHQIVLYGFLCFQIKQGRVSNVLLEQIRDIANELAQQIYSKGDKMTIEERTLVYLFFKKLTVFSLGSQEIFDKIFLLILPRVIQDAQNDVSVKNYSIKESNIVQEAFDDIELEEENQGEQEEDLDAEQYDQFNYLIPSDTKISLVESSLSILAVFSEQSPEIFMNYKKFDILNVLINNQFNSDLTEDIIIQSQSIIGRIFVSVQKYLISLENQTQEQQDLGLNDNQLVELDPIIDILLYRFLNHKMHLFVQKCEDRLYQELNNTLEKSDKKTIFSYFDKFYGLVESILFENINTCDTNKIGNCIYSIIDILKAAPSKIMQALPQTWNIIKLILTEKEELYVTYEEYISQQKQQAREDISSNNEEDFSEKFTEDPFVVIRCIFEIWEIIKIQPESYKIFKSVFHYIILNQEFQQYEQYLQSICAYLKKIIRHCQSYLNVEEVQAYYQIIQKVAFKVDENYFREISPVENLRIAFAMLQTYLDSRIPDQNIQQNDSYTLFLEIIPLRDEIGEFPQVLYIFEHLIQNNYEFNVIQKNNVVKTILKAINDPGVQDVDEKNLQISFKILKKLCQNDYDKQIILKHIEKEITNFQKEVIVKYLEI
ncbi:hypothetical protein TTHERM_00820770 (macronuclear) [Tetrahymena thermophila SB210]|uniref:Uncharacterized protein n=1 Tax=Tetrahymena thermophila (strain SB210) TaxID=312017 RepID=Q23H68_TETTS|nr:hypothetical protein TTHERM_00820770 [Tetrahymena thermophila SB210]EAR95940.2 hypothetical protein TTHERM_00820770 [Tetrahymena thermophila SB210]|eukprot:XP_001016185.2 hypothetical protein TTHERM_00820770 [Tetrahymena thermophila SB210]